MQWQKGSNLAVVPDEANCTCTSDPSSYLSAAVVWQKVERWQKFQDDQASDRLLPDASAFHTIRVMSGDDSAETSQMQSFCSRSAPVPIGCAVSNCQLHMQLCVTSILLLHITLGQK